MRPNVPLDQWDADDVEAAVKNHASPAPAAPVAGPLAQSPLGPSPQTPAPPAPNGPVSRRDFLRRAGKEAVQTGTQLAPLVPGAALAKTALGIGATGANGAKPQSLMARLAGWRNKRADEADDATPTQTPNGSEGETP